MFSKRLRVFDESADYEISCLIRKKRSRTRGVRSWDEFDLIRNFSSDNNSSVNVEAQSKAGNDVRKMKKPRENLDSCVSGSKFGKFNSGFASDEEQQAELEVSVDESLSCDKFKKSTDINKGINHTELELKKELETEVGFDQDDLILQTTNFVDQDFELEGNSCDDQVQNATADSEFLKDFGRKRKLKCKTTHKTVDSCIALKMESCGVGVTSYDLKRSKEHECSICFKVFASGQALGGHKRAHYIGLTERRGKEIILMDQELPDRVDENLDFNFPVTLEEEESTTDVGLKPWWAGYNRKCEPLAIFN